MIFLFNLIGCASVEGRKLYYGAYPGVRYGIDNISGHGLTVGDYGWQGKVLYLLDLPLSFVMDTVLLPFDVFHKREKKEAYLKEDNSIVIEPKNITLPVPQ